MNFGILSFTDNSICEIGQYVPNRCNRENRGGFALPFECIHLVRAAGREGNKIIWLGARPKRIGCRQRSGLRGRSFKGGTTALALLLASEICKIFWDRVEKTAVNFVQLCGSLWCDEMLISICFFFPPAQQIILFIKKRIVPIIELGRTITRPLCKRWGD